MGRETLCPDRKFTGDAGMVGGYAEYVAIEDDNVALVPDGVALQDASIVACAIGTDPQRDARGRQAQPRARARSSPARAAGSACTRVQLARLAGAFVIAQTTSPGEGRADPRARRA